MTQVHERRTDHQAEEDTVETNEAVLRTAGNAAAQQEIDTSEIDKTLKEIDEVLEKDAEAYVASYVQKGGQ